MYSTTDVRGTGSGSGNQITNEDRGLVFPGRNPQQRATSHKSSKEAQVPQRPTVNTLFIHDTNANPPLLYMNLVQQFYYPNATVVGIANWEQLTQALSQYSQIQTLVINAHGEPGSLAIGGRGPSVSEMRSYFGRSQVRITEAIRFESCNVMRNPVSTAQMVQDIVTPEAEVRGYTLYMKHAPIYVQIPSGSSEAEIQRNYLDLYRGYWCPGTPTASYLVAHPGPHTLLLQWFGSDMSLDLPPQRTSPTQLRSRSHVSRSQMTEHRVNTFSEAAAVRSRYASPGEITLEEIIITNVADVANARSQRVLSTLLD